MVMSSNAMKGGNKESNVQGAPSSVTTEESTEIKPETGSMLVVYTVHRFFVTHTHMQVF